MKKHKHDIVQLNLLCLGLPTAKYRHISVSHYTVNLFNIYRYFISIIHLHWTLSKYLPRSVIGSLLVHLFHKLLPRQHSSNLYFRISLLNFPIFVQLKEGLRRNEGTAPRLRCLTPTPTPHPLSGVDWLRRLPAWTLDFLQVIHADLRRLQCFIRWNSSPSSCSSYSSSSSSSSCGITVLCEP